MMFLWLPLLFVVPFLIWWSARPESAGSSPSLSTSTGRDEAREIVRQRFARGEITAAQYNEILSALR